MQKNRNRILALLKTEELSKLSHHFREVAIEQGQLLEERGERVDSVHFPQTGMISLIVEIPEDRSLEVGTVGFEGAVGTDRHPASSASNNANRPACRAVRRLGNNSLDMSRRIYIAPADSPLSTI